MDLRKEFSPPPRVLIADDDWYIRDMLAHTLSSAGCAVELCADGEQAWNAIQESPPDLAMLDIRMPRMSGLAVCQQIKSNPNTQFVPVIIVTALTSENDELEAIQAGADDFVIKPFRSTMLLTRVRSLLRLKRLHDDLESRNALLRQVLNRYVDQEIADVILTDPERHLKLGGETRQVTVLFADLRDFTRFAASHPAPQVVDLLNYVFTELVEIVVGNHGTFDKFIGDAIMAFYGAPLRSDDDAERALRTALEMQAGFKRLQDEATGQPLSQLGLGIGIHSGEVIVGNIGSERMMDYTVIGDAVNVARRLQEMARTGEIWIGETTRRFVPGAQVENLGPKRLPGRDDPVRVFRLWGLS